jgi:hypothetical protein
MEDPTQAHVRQKLLHPNVVYVVIGCLLIVVAAGWFLLKGQTGNSVTPASGPEGTQISFSVPKTTAVGTPVTATITDSGEHGYVAVQAGGGSYVKYDDTKGLTYSAPASAAPDGDNVKYSVTVPQGVCGLVIKSENEPMPPPKVVTVALNGPDGKPIAGMKPFTFQVTCDVFTLKVVTKATKDPVLPDGVDNTTITATFTVSGPAQFINAQRIPPGGQKPIITTPLGLMMVNVTTNLGVMNPGSPANIKTDLNGEVSVVLSSNDAGIADVRFVASGVGDAKQQIHFMPKITAVKMDFVPPKSPTNYEIKTIPANAKDLTIDWKFIPAAGNSCGSMTGPLSGKGLTKNGFFHGPNGNFTDGCPEDWEHASQIQVTVTDKDGQTDTKTFSARDFEGRGFVNLP